MSQSMPNELAAMIAETDRLAKEIQALRAKQHLTDADVKKLADLKAEILQICPPDRFAWVEAFPVVDILKTLQDIQKEEISRGNSHEK